MDQFARRIIGLGVQRGAVDGPSLCRMFNDALRGQGAPRHLSTDHDRLFEDYRWQATLRVLEIDDIKTVPYGSLTTNSRPTPQICDAAIPVLYAASIEHVDPSRSIRYTGRTR